MKPARSLKPARLLWTLVPLLAALPLPTPDLSAQDRDPPPAALEGEVVDSVTGAPVADVLVRVDSGEEAFSDEDGRFRLHGLAAGAHTLALLTADCRVTWREIELEPGGVASIRVALTTSPSAREERERRERNRRASAGTLVTTAEMEEMGALNLAEVARRVEPNMVGRSRNSLQSTEVRIGVLVDGVLAADGVRTLELLRPSDVETMELLPGVAAGWTAGSAGSSGLIRIVTRKGGRPPDGGDAGGCVVPDFPGG